jgi:hypothetical protein
MKYIAIFFILLLLVHIYSQNTDEIQTMLAGHLNRMNYYKYDSFNPDSVEIENSHFKRLFLKYLNEYPASFQARWITLLKQV